jgi:hypothetical protein
MESAMRDRYEKDNTAHRKELALSEAVTTASYTGILWPYRQTLHRCTTCRCPTNIQADHGQNYEAIQATYAKVLCPSSAYDATCPSSLSGYQMQ